MKFLYTWKHPQPSASKSGRTASTIWSGLIALMRCDYLRTHNTVYHFNRKLQQLYGVQLGVDEVEQHAAVYALYRWGAD